MLARCSSGLSPTSTIWGNWLKTSILTVASFWATSSKLSATSVWSMQPGRLPRQSNRHRYRHSDLPPHSPALTAWPPNCWRMVAISRSA
jgi:hypothetical protein